MKDHMDHLIDAVLKLIDSYENPYPPDVYTHDNPEPMNITRGRFNRHVYEVVENTRRDIKELIKEWWYEDQNP